MSFHIFCKMSGNELCRVRDSYESNLRWGYYYMIYSTCLRTKQFVRSSSADCDFSLLGGFGVWAAGVKAEDVSKTCKMCTWLERRDLQNVELRRRPPLRLPLWLWLPLLLLLLFSLFLRRRRPSFAGAAHTSSVPHFPCHCEHLVVVVVLCRVADRRGHDPELTKHTICM
jgi:hypothetical protein